MSVDAWMSIKSLDRNEHIVCIWGDESFTDKEGKKISRRVQEVWVFNSADKIGMMYQYSGMGGL